MAIKPVSGEIKAQVLNDNFSALDSNLANLSIGPFDTYTNLSALQSAYPNGRNGFAVVLEADGKTGYMYTWTGTTWKKGGLAQSMGISDYSITEKKVSDEIATTSNKNNLFARYSKSIKDKSYVANDTGAVIAHNDILNITIPVKPGSILYVESSVPITGLQHQGSFFSESSFVVSLVQAISYQRNIARTKMMILVPNNAAIKFLKLNMLNANMNHAIYYMMSDKIPISINRSAFDFSINKDDGIFMDDIYQYYKETQPFVEDVNLNAEGRLAQATNVNIIASTYAMPVKAGEKYQIENFYSETIKPAAFVTRGIYLDGDMRVINMIPAPTDINNESPIYTIPTGVSNVIWHANPATINQLKITRVLTASDKKIFSGSIYPPLDNTPVFTGRKFVGFGDSITLRETWQETFVQKTGYEFINCGEGGSQVAGERTHAFHTEWRLQTVFDANPDAMSILGGANDIVPDNPIGTDAEFTKVLNDKDKNNFKGAYSYIIERLLTWKPTLQIFIMTTTWAHDDGATWDPPSGVRYKDYAQACRDVAHYYGLPIIDLYYDLGINRLTVDTMTIDKIHLSSFGGKRMGALVASEVLKFYAP